MIAPDKDDLASRLDAVIEVAHGRVKAFQEQAAAAALVVEQVGRGPGLATIAAVGHRVVHGGELFVEPAPVTAAMLDQLRRISPLDPEHLPGERALIEAIGRALPEVPLVA